MKKQDSYGNQAIWRIAAPMIASGISVPLLGMVDTAVVGHLSDPLWLAAVATGAAIFSTLFLSLNFLRMGTTGLTAQAFGRNDFVYARTVLGQSVVIGLLLGLLIAGLQTPLLSMSLYLLAPAGDIASAASEYFAIRVWAAPATLINYALIGWFLGMQNARAPLAIMLLTNVINIALDLLFVPGLGWKADGVAWATVIAEHCGLALAVVLAHRELGKRPGLWPRSALLQPLGYLRLFQVNGNLFIRSVALLFTFAFITAQGARLGGLILAANAVLMNLQFFLSHALDGIAHAAEALTGKAAGAQDRRALEETVRRTLAWSCGFAAAYTLVYLVFGRMIINLITDIPEVRATAIVYLPWLIASPLLSVWCFLYDGVYVGLTRSREMRDIMLGSLLVVFLPVWYLTQDLGNHGLWLAFSAFMAARGIGMWWLSRSIIRSVAAR